MEKIIEIFKEDNFKNETKENIELKSSLYDILNFITNIKYNFLTGEREFDLNTIKENITESKNAKIEISYSETNDTIKLLKNIEDLDKLINEYENFTFNHLKIKSGKKIKVFKFYQIFFDIAKEENFSKIINEICKENNYFLLDYYSNALIKENCYFFDFTHYFKTEKDIEKKFSVLISLIHKVFFIINDKFEEIESKENTNEKITFTLKLIIQTFNQYYLTELKDSLISYEVKFLYSFHEISKNFVNYKELFINYKKENIYNYTYYLISILKDNFYKLFIYNYNLKLDIDEKIEFKDEISNTILYVLLENAKKNNLGNNLKFNYDKIHSIYDLNAKDENINNILLINNEKIFYEIILQIKLTKYKRKYLDKILNTINSVNIYIDNDDFFNFINDINENIKRFNLEKEKNKKDIKKFILKEILSLNFVE